MATATMQRVPPVHSPLPRRILRRLPDLFLAPYYRACYIRQRDSSRRVAPLAGMAVHSLFFKAIQNREELIAFGDIVLNLRPECVLEIGTAGGGTLWFISRLASPNAVLVSVDLPGGPFGGGYGPLRAWCYQHLFPSKNQKIVTIRADSHRAETLERVKEALDGRPVDLLFIDGDHSYEGVKRDFEWYAPLVRVGGLIAFHDIVVHPPETGCEVSKFWNEIKTRYVHREIVNDWDQGWAGIGILVNGARRENDSPRPFAPGGVNSADASSGPRGSSGSPAQR